MTPVKTLPETQPWLLARHIIRRLFGLMPGAKELAEAQKRFEAKRHRMIDIETGLPIGRLKTKRRPFTERRGQD